MTRTPVAILGLGVIGGSLARALIHDRAWTVTGFAASETDRLAAASSGIAVAPTLEEAVAPAGDGVVMIAVPLDRIAEVATATLRVAPGALVLHAGSLQGVAAVRLPDGLRERVFGTHPIAGTHRAGFTASRADLFRGASVSIESRLGLPDRDRAGALWRAAGATRLEIREAGEHDALMAWVSHLPQLVATALASVLDAGGAPPDAFGPGARDTTRLAQSSFELWRPILERAPRETLEALRAARDALTALERELTGGPTAPLEHRWHRARTWRAKLEPT